jgi:hypothetical protein
VLRTADIIIPGHFSELHRVSPTQFAPADVVLTGVSGMPR